ncbi:cytochrome P450 6B5-like isoform X1 [Leguminivora glycinivorella]|uniref:cytochrome P450 6B5-like isoform X1 n=2 Tax=Leguminivora glycinivorella TaxID=1035111 RepID=UPI00200D435F|nr:cytochrome P450 6B5-like isoform X1 [Leguminivora glycinivorella]
MYIFLLLVFGVLLAFWKYNTINKGYWKKRGVNTQIEGTTFKFLIGNCSLSEHYKKIYDEHPNEENIGIFQGSRPAIILRNLENMQFVLSGDFLNFYSRGLTTNPEDTLADNVLFMEDYERWKLVRQKLSPVFTSLRLRNMFYIVERCASDFAKLLEENEEFRQKPFNACYTYTTSALGASVFGIDTAVNTMHSPFLDMAWKSLEPTFRANFRFFLSNTFPFLFRLFKLKAFAEHEDFFINVVRKMLANRRVDTRKHYDFIDICLELQNAGTMHDPTTGYSLEPTDEILAAQAFFFFIAGADTSANTMHFTLLELSNNVKILKKVHEEIDKVFDECGERLTHTDLENLGYLDMVLSEAMRKYPPVGLMQRRCTNDTVLPVGNVPIEKDSIMVVPIYAIHRDPKYWPNPEVFDPERFSPENAPKIKKYSYMPFGEGSRICLGVRFGRQQVKAGLAWLLRRFTLAEQVYAPAHFEPSFFALRDPYATYELIPRYHAQKA